MSRRELLMKRLQMYDFVLVETGLFLDSHPDSADALAHYQKYRKLREEALDEYTKNYGTVSRNHPKNPEVWDWVEEPWPWEKED